MAQAQQAAGAVAGALGFGVWGYELVTEGTDVLTIVSGIVFLREVGYSGNTDMVLGGSGGRRFTIWFIGVINLLSPPDLPSSSKSLPL